jgi:hypothetical protein
VAFVAFVALWHCGIVALWHLWHLWHLWTFVDVCGRCGLTVERRLWNRLYVITIVHNYKLIQILYFV